MTEAFETADTNKQMMYTFCFSTSNEIVHLTQQQVDCFAHLSTLVAHKNYFSSIQNENGEYELNPPIDSIRFKTILHSITLKQPYHLFNELPEDENIMDTLHLLDYLGVESFPSPLLNDVILTRLNPINNDNNEERHVNYDRASLPETRNTSANFIVALSKNKYDLNDIETLEKIFSLIMLIISDRLIYNSRFRHHTLTVVKECCFQLFSFEQQSQLPTSQQSFQNSPTGSLDSSYDDDQPLSEDFDDTFALRAVYKSINEKAIDRSGWSSFHMLIIGPSKLGKSALPNCMFESMHKKSIQLSKTRDSQSSFHSSENHINPNRLNASSTRLSSMIENINDKQCYISESDLARSEIFNTLPKRANVDKFKHRSGPKARKYR